MGTLLADMSLKRALHSRPIMLCRVGANEAAASQALIIIYLEDNENLLITESMTFLRHLPVCSYGLSSELLLSLAVACRILYIFTVSKKL